MFAHFKRLANQVLYYGLGDTINRLVAVLILPVFTRFLSPADYGVASLLTVTNALIVSFTDFGLHQSIIRFYREESPAKQKQLIATAQFAMVMSTLIIALIAWPFASQISQLFFKTPAYAYIVTLNFFTIPLTKLITAPMVRFRVEEKAKFYAFLSVAQIVTMIGLNFLFIVGLKHGVNGLFEGPFISAAIFALGIGVYSIIQNGLKFSYPLFSKMFTFGAPLILNSVSMWIINWADRFILAKIASLAEVGLYTLGYSIGMAITLPVNAFVTAWSPFYMRIAKDTNAPKIYATVFTYYSAVIGFFVILVSVFGRDYFNFFTQAKFHGAAIVIPAIALAYALRGNFSIVAAAAYLKQKTYLVTVIEVIAMILNVALVFILVKYFGRIGAAWATLISFAVLPIGMHFLTRKIFPIKYEFKRILQIIFIGLIIYGATQLIYQPTLVNVLIRLGIVLCYPLAFFALGFFEPSELATIIKIKNRFFKIKTIDDSNKIEV